ncbi:YoaK family protein [Acidicapsa acidisoli]|uniref:YoaK family protein n=1 Tax=Acidicapsa acidisoli TaxID=1615681 RepID=UPI0021E0E378|nr:YoaK family protein [Acidicapsa acidisoli]
MDSLTKSERILHGSLYCLTFVTGLVDAGSYVAMGHVFTANMTGNVVFLGFAFGGVPGLSIGRSATALGFALVGGFLAGKLDSWLGRRRRNIWLAAALAIEAILLLGAMTVSWYSESRGGQQISTALYGIIALTALGMGMRNGTVRLLAVPELTTTVLTLTVAALAFDFSLTPGNNPRWRRRVGSVFMMFSGAFVGVQMLRHSLVLLLGASAILTAFCVLAQIYREETQHEAGLRASQS